MRLEKIITKKIETGKEIPCPYVFEITLALNFELCVAALLLLLF
jgi:hypothetical protein